MMILSSFVTCKKTAMGNTYKSHLQMTSETEKQFLRKSHHLLPLMVNGNNLAL